MGFGTKGTTALPHPLEMAERLARLRGDLQSMHLTLVEVAATWLQSGNARRAIDILQGIRNLDAYPDSLCATEFVKHLFAVNKDPAPLVTQVRDYLRSAGNDNRSRFEVVVATGFWKRADFPRFKEAFKAIQPGLFQQDVIERLDMGVLEAHPALFDQTLSLLSPELAERLVQKKERCEAFHRRIRS